jgi:RNA polymerase sigma-70 factor (ECF subfamily)
MKDTDILLFIDGNKKGFEALYNEYYKIVFFVVNKRVFGYDDVCNLTQDIFLEVYNSRNNYRGGNIKYFVLSIAGNIVSDFIKKEIKRKTAERNYVSTNIVQEDDNLLDDLLVLAANSLDSKSYDIIISHYIDKLKYNEIAKKYNESTSTITNIASRAIKTLKKEYYK